ncbi:MAG: MaoC family dehydratase [Candidatus Caldarchaeum sp.]|nr:MaoC family dehydratase [Candidatus Caldarchaeum sp.]
MKIITGYPGFLYETVEEGQVIVHRLGRTVTFQDNLFLSHTLLNTACLHFDKEYMQITEFKQPLLVMTMVMGITYGIVSEDFKNIAREVEIRNMRMLAPVFDGDTLHVISEILEKRPHVGREDVGIVRIRHKTYKNNFSTQVMELEREVLMYKREHLPRWRLESQSFSE